jgi:hypothetical protein
MHVYPYACTAAAAPRAAAAAVPGCPALTSVAAVLPPAARRRRMRYGAAAGRPHPRPCQQKGVPPPLPPQAVTCLVCSIPHPHSHNNNSSSSSSSSSREAARATRGDNRCPTPTCSLLLHRCPRLARPTQTHCSRCARVCVCSFLCDVYAYMCVFFCYPTLYCTTVHI